MTAVFIKMEMKSHGAVVGGKKANSAEASVSMRAISQILQTLDQMLESPSSTSSQACL